MRTYHCSWLLVAILICILCFGCSMPFPGGQGGTYPPAEQTPPPTTSEPQTSSSEPPSRDSESSSTLGTYSFEAYNYPGYFIRHQNYIAKLSTIKTDLDRQDSTFRIVQGLAGKCKSFEAVMYPGYYLRHQNYMIKLAKYDGSSLFQKDATFCFQNGLANSSDYSFESYNYPGYYIRHKNYTFYIDRDRGDLFNKDATFRQKFPNW